MACAQRARRHARSFKPTLIALAISCASFASFQRAGAIDTGRRCCVYAVERPEKDWDYNFRTTGVALFKRKGELLATDEDGYVTTLQVSGDQCYEWDRFLPSRADANRPLSERSLRGATMRWTDENYAYLLEVDSASEARILHLYETRAKIVTASLVLADGQDISDAGGGVSWAPDGTESGKFLFALKSGQIAVYDIVLTPLTQSATRTKTLSLPVESDDTDLRGIYVNEKETNEDVNEIWAIFGGSDRWYVFDFSQTDVSLVGTSYRNSGTMHTDRAHPTKPGALAVWHDRANSDVLRVFVGNRAKWVYELHVRRGKDRFKECPWHEKNLQACCSNRYLTSCTEKTRDDCTAEGSTFMGAWKHWNSGKDLCLTNVCGVDNIANPSLAPPTVPPLPVSHADDLPTTPLGYNVNYYEYPTGVDIDNSQENIDEIIKATPFHTETWASTKKDEGSQPWFDGHNATDAFFVSMSATWHVINAGSYQIQLSCVGICRAYVNGKVIVEHPKEREMREDVRQNVFLTPGNSNMFVTYASDSGSSGLKVKILGPDTGKGTILTNFTEAVGAGLYTDGPTSPHEPKPSSLTHAVTSFEFDDFDYIFYNRRDNDFDWVRDSKKTPSLWTGPTNAADKKKFVYAEVSGKRAGAITRLQSVEMTLGAGAFFSIQHSMYGKDMGTLLIDVLYDGKYSNIFSATGNQGAGWEPIILDIGEANVPGKVISFLITYIVDGRDTRGDAALDDFRAYLGDGAGGVGDVPTEDPPLPAGAGTITNLPTSQGPVPVDNCQINANDSNEEISEEFEECYLSDESVAGMDADGETTDAADDIDPPLSTRDIRRINNKLKRKAKRMFNITGEQLNDETLLTRLAREARDESEVLILEMNEAKTEWLRGVKTYQHALRRVRQAKRRSVGIEQAEEAAQQAYLDKKAKQREYRRAKIAAKAKVKERRTAEALLKYDAAALGETLQNIVSMPLTILTIALAAALALTAYHRQRSFVIHRSTQERQPLLHRRSAREYGMSLGLAG